MPSIRVSVCASVRASVCQVLTYTLTSHSFIKISSSNLQGMFMATVSEKFWPYFENQNGRHV